MKYEYTYVLFGRSTVGNTTLSFQFYCQNLPISQGQSKDLQNDLCTQIGGTFCAGWTDVASLKVDMMEFSARPKGLIMSSLYSGHQGGYS